MRHSIYSILKVNPKRYFWIVFLILLTACTSAPTEMDANAISTQAASTVVARMTQTAASQPTATITPSASPTETSALTPSPMPLPLFPLDGYVMLFTRNGDLYFQDGNLAPVQLTHGEETPTYSLISEDNKKIVFLRGKSSNDNYSNIYSINTDGSQKQALITPQWLAALGEGTGVRFPVFVSGTHQLLFNTYLCESQEYSSPCSVGIFFVDADTGEIKKFLAPGPADQHDPLSSNFQVSPDGEMVSIVTIGHIDILNMDGKVIRRDILPYTPSIPSYNAFSLLPVQFWLSDSSGLTAALPDTTNHIDAYGIVPAYTVWRYTIDNDTAVQISLDPFPMIFTGCDKFQVSPNGNWILYGGSGDYASSLYIGNLGNGHTQLYDSKVCPRFSWSPDSEHFLYGNFLGTIDKPPVSIKAILPLAWIDVGHFTYFEPLKNIHEADVKILVAEIRGETILSFDLGLSLPNLVTIKPK